MAKVVGLQQHITELCIRQTICFSNSTLHRIFGQHLIHCYVLTDLAQEVEHRDLASPVGVVNQSRLCWTLFEIQNSLELPFDALHIVVQCLRV